MNKIIIRLSKLTGLVLIILAPAILKAQSRSVKKGASANFSLPFDTAVHQGKLPNGFTYYIRHNKEPQNRVIMYLVNKVGSVLEDDDQQGLAHFLEHMSFNGTKTFPKHALVDYLQKSGIRFGADLNAYTSYDETVYQLPLPANNPELLKNGLQVMRDWAHDATLDTKEIDAERGVVLEEKRLGRGAQERMRNQYLPVILAGSRYASRLPIGTENVITTFRPETIRRFYHDWYRPNLQALIVVGDIDPAQITQMVKALFSDLKNPVNERPRNIYSVELNGKNQFVAATDEEMSTTVAQLIFKQRKLDLITEKDYRQSLIRQLINRMLGDRYAELLQQANPPFIHGQAGIDSYIGGLDAYQVSVVAKPGQLERGLKAVWQETQNAKKYGFTGAELKRAKSAVYNQVETSFNERDKIPSSGYVNEYVQHFLHLTASPGIAVEFDIIKKHLPSIELMEINKAIREYVKDTDRTILLMAPDKDKSALPDEATVESWLNSVETLMVKPANDTTTEKALYTLKPIPGKVTMIKTDAVLKTKLLTLSNGIKVLLKPTSFKNSEVQFIGFAPGGSSLYSDEDFESASASADLISSFGAGNLNQMELNRYLSDKQVRVMPFISERFQGVSGSASTKDLEHAFQLLYARWTQPRIDSLIFRGIIDRSVAGLTNRESDPGSVFSDSINAILSDHHIRRTGPGVDKLRQIDLIRSFSIYQERFADASNFQFVFVGSFDEATLIPLLEKYLGSLHSNHTSEQARDLNINIPKGNFERRIFKGKENKATVQLVFSGSFDYNIQNAIHLDALKECLEIRLLERLREDEGGVYSPAVSASVSKLPQGRYTFSVSFGCSPANVDKLIASVMNEIGVLKISGPPQVNIDKWRAEEHNLRENQLLTNGFWMSYLTTQLQNGEPLDEYLSYTALHDAVKPVDIKMAANNFLSGDNFIRLILLPENI